MSFTKVKPPVFTGGRKWGVCAGGVRKVIVSEGRRPEEAWSCKAEGREPGDES